MDNVFNNIVVNEADALDVMQKELIGIKKNVVDFDVNNLLKKYIVKGGYDFALTPQENIGLFVQALALMKAKKKI